MNSKKNLKRNLLICLLAGSAVMYTLPLHAATSVIGNGTLPSGGQFFDGNKFTQGTVIENGHNFKGIGSITKPNDLTMNVHQNNQNAVIKWDSFNVGGSATVNFTSDKSNFNTLNYVNSGAASQIYGTINGLGGNIYVVNTAGVQIGPSAQINVGSLHVSSNTLDDNALADFYNNAHTDNFKLDGMRNTDIELMSLGNINASKVTFEGDGRIVIDSERLKDVAGTEKLTADKIFVNTKDENNLVIGYDGYDENNGGSYNTASKDINIVTVNGNGFAQNKGYMWVEDVEQLQAINTNLSGNYALRNSIDATSTEQKDFISIGSDNSKAFTGNFDGIDYNIFGLTINGGDNTGLFGYTNNATISNVTLVGGSITGKDNVGAIVGNANNTTLTNVVNSAAVSGNSYVGGIVGSADGTTVENAINTGTIEGNSKNETNVGGLIGEMKDSNLTDNYSSELIGNSYNLGDVSGNGHNVGGLVGHAVNSTIGDGTNLVYNRLDVTGAYNVGGIVGNMEGSTVKYAENSGTVLATGHSTEDYIYHTAITLQDNIPNGGRLDDAKDIAKVIVDVANVGGIAGTSAAKDGKASEITNVTNAGDVSSSKVAEQNYYAAGNVGGVVGRAEDTNITTATNRENDIRGAHNVGGIAGYFGSSKGDETGENVPRYTVTSGINDGGDIMATGARGNGNFVQELVRRVADGSNEKFTVGNIGGVVGYMDGDNVYVTGSANRGTVHTSEPAEPADVKDWEKAANVGGVVGKIDRSGTLELDDIENDITKAAVSNSYNTGDVLGYTGVGGVVGMMYNGEVAGSYNLGYIGTTRQTPIDGTNIDSLNMGGVVGDTTENANAEGVVIYDVYNKGQIGDSEFNYFGRHVGGVVGRLSGTVEKAYNTGAIYNGYSVVGGIAGWVAAGSINNAFNTGNITVYNQNKGIESQVGGIAGSVKGKEGTTTISNAYNLGTIRSFKAKTNNSDKGINLVGGIVGDIRNSGEVIIKNVYTTGNIYAGIENASGNITEDTGNNIGSIYGRKNGNTTKTNAYYIKPAKDENEQPLFTELTGNRDNSNKPIKFDDKHKISEYQCDIDGEHYSLTFTTQSGGDVDGGNKDIVASDDNWRIYDGNTPILNAFLPKAEDYFSGETGKENAMDGIGSIQYGTAYDPLLTIIKANGQKDNLSYSWEDLGINNAAGIAVYGAGLTLGDFKATGGSGYFGGTIYADGALNINGTENINIGSAADIYGSAVNITTDGKVTIYGDVMATGNATNGVDDSEMNVQDAGDITINAGDVDVYGKLTSASDTHGSSVTIPGIEGSAVTWEPGKISNPDVAMSDIADRFAHTTGASAVDGNITITANGTPTDVDGDGTIETDEVIGGNVNLYYGNKGEGLITTGGDLTVTGAGDVYVDSDLNIGGNLTLAGTGAESEVVLDITNIGQVQDKNDNSPDIDNSTEYLHDFLDHFTNTTDNSISFGNTQDAKITVDMWENNKLNLDKFATDFTGKLNTLHITNANGKNAQQLTHIWVSNGDQLKGIQEAAKENSDILGYNFALKGDINASHVEDYEAIGGENGAFNGTFDGRGNRIIGLDTTKDSSDGNTNSMTKAGIFSTVGEGGVVKDVNIYSGTFTGSKNAGTVAGKNNGRIEGIVTFGNTVTVTGEDGNAGGIVGVNTSGEFSVVDKETGSTNGGELTGGIYDVESTGSVIAGNSNAIAGGLVGTNNGGLANSFSDSAVTVKVDNQNPVTTTGGLGGVVGVNTEKGNVQYVDSLGVTNGGATNSSNIGGIIGTSNGNMYSGYNESIVSGKDNVGGIIGENSTGGTVTNIVNATSVTGENESADNVSQYVGGLVGSNSGSVTNGRNNGTITGTNYVGGMVGNNADEHSILTNLVNDSSAAIEGERYVGGIAGSNSGTITADKKNDNLINRGSITGNKYVGGVAGENKDGGTIANTLNSVVLHAKGENAQYFGGVVGQNSGEINGATNTSNIDITAVGGSYVGGIIGQNTESGTLKGEIRNEGSVAGKSQVGGIIGENDNDYVLIGTEGNRLTVENDGSVDAQEGGAAGIFYENHGEIKYADISNSGVVNGGDKEGGTGGLFGINTGNITESTLTNSGTVIGGGIVGGLIGKNSGDVSNSSLTNTGSVIGTSNVGGLIGTNTGKIEGGRDANNSYYKYQIYNNGVINVGTWDDTNNNGKVDAGEITGLQQGETSQNIGGLIGNNTTENGKTGSLTAGYNTGAINAGSSTNVGGIAGSNAGTIDQVFNTVMTENGENQTITGGTNVGGLVGNNSGTLSNAYNTTEVKGNANVGTIIGNNATNNVSNVYNTWDTENSTLISTGNSADNAYNIDSNKQTDYSRLDFNDTWKIYEGNSNPLLKVFLTNLIIKDINNEGTSLKEFLNLVYNGKEQDLNIKALIDNGFIVVPDEEALKAYHNTLIGNNLGESYLINNTDGQKTAGKHNNWLYSEQIHVNTSGEFNPNNLGYDITFANNDKGILEIDKAKLTITLDDIYRIYGQEGLKDGYEYGFSIDGLADSDKNLANDIIIEEGTIEDGALVDINNDGKVTNDVNDIDNPYKWTADVTLSDYIEQNYNILYDGGNSHVTKADLTITADNKETMPGVMPDFTGTDIQQGLVNGDSAGTYDYNLDGSVNIDVDGTYTDKIGISFDNGETYYDLENVDWSTIPGWDFLKNYDINFKPGTLIVSSELLPDIPSDWPHNRWDYLFNDAPFDRTKDFRERKAEINFVDGGMEI